MDDIPVIIWMLLAMGLVVLGIHGSRGLLAIHQALHDAELDRLADPPRWPQTRALVGVLAAVPVVAATRSLGVVALLSGLAVTGLGYCLSPHILAAAKRRVQTRILGELALHLDLMAIAMEAGSSWSAALVLCTERAPDGPLRRAWQRVILEIHGGAQPLDALRNLEQRLRLPAMTTLVSTLRAAEKLQISTSAVLRDRSRQTQAQRFARAERQARAAPLKLWAAMLLCLAPCTAVVLAFPLAQLLMRLLG
jgi:tight adherence protein C